MSAVPCQMVVGTVISSMLNPQGRARSQDSRAVAAGDCVNSPTVATVVGQCWGRVNTARSRAGRVDTSIAAARCGARR